MVYWTPISNPLTSWERGYVGVLGCIISILMFSYLSIRMHTTVWRLQCYARLHHILILLSSHSVCTYVHPCLAYVLYSTTRLSFSVYVTTYLYTYYVCALVYYTVHAPYHHIWYSATSYTSTCALLSIHIHTSTYITYHLVCHHLISSSYYTTSGICYMACAIPRSVAYVLLCHVSSIPRYHVMECPYGHPYHHRISTYPHIHRIHGIHGIHDLDPFWHAKTRPWVATHDCISTFGPYPDTLWEYLWPPVDT